MTLFDYIVLGVVGVSVFVSIMRGAVREIFAVLGWVASVWVARTYATELAPLLPPDIPTESLKLLAAFVILMLSVLLVSSLLCIAISKLMDKIGASWLNRAVGALFGFARGLLIVCVLVLLAGLTSIPKDPRWVNAMFSPPLEVLVKSMLPWLPETLTKHIKYD
jgi:membrane protein required for colicin V production